MKYFKAQNIYIKNTIHRKWNCSKWNHETGVACWEGPWQCMLGDFNGYFYRMIWFLQLPDKDLSGNTMAFSSITSEGTWTLLPMRSKTTGAWRNSWQIHMRKTSYITKSINNFHWHNETHQWQWWMDWVFLLD